MVPSRRQSYTKPNTQDLRFIGSAGGGRAAAIAYTLIETARLNGIDPEGWLADTLARIPDHKITRVDELMPWRWHGASTPSMRQAA